MRQTIAGLVAAFAVMTVGAAPATACGGGLFQGSCSPCGQAYVEPCAQPQVYQPPVYVPPAPVYSGCNPCGGGYGYERLVEPETQYYAAPAVRHQYYYVNQGPTYTGPGDLAPVPTYRETAYGPRVYGYRTHHYYRPHHYGYGYSMHPGYRYGYAHRSMRYGMRHHYYGYRQHVLRRYY